MQLIDFKKKNRYTFKDLERIFDTSTSNLSRWIASGAVVRGPQGARRIELSGTRVLAEENPPANRGI